MVFRGLGLGGPQAIFERNWFALKNFHCHWFEDSDVLEGYLHFRRETLEDHLRQISERSPWYVKLVSAPGVGRLIPKRLVKELIMKPLARSKNGPLHWIENGVEGRITAFFGSRENWARIPDWGADGPERDVEPIRLYHGYDEDKPRSQLDLDDMRGAAVFRGGECLSQGMSQGDLSSKLRWSCAFGHEFDASPTLVLLAGHWCPTCAPPPWNYDEIAKRQSLPRPVLVPQPRPERVELLRRALLRGHPVERAKDGDRRRAGRGSRRPRPGRRSVRPGSGRGGSGQ